MATIYVSSAALAAFKTTGRRLCNDAASLGQFLRSTHCHTVSFELQKNWKNCGAEPGAPMRCGAVTS